MGLFLLFLSFPAALCSHLASSPGIVTQITSANGTDISPAFETLVFEEAPRDTLANLTDRQVPWTREISSCRHENAVFQYSYCRRHRYSAADLRAYTVVCKAPPPGPGYFSPRTILEHDFCTPNELCMDGPKDTNYTRGRQALPTKAFCIGKSGFLPVEDFLQYQQLHGFHMWRHQKTGQIRVSYPDKSTPLNAQHLDLTMVGYNESDLPISQDASCKDCSGLTVPENNLDVDLLKTQATIGASAGILWLAFLSG